MRGVVGCLLLCLAQCLSVSHCLPLLVTPPPLDLGWTSLLRLQSATFGSPQSHRPQQLLSSFQSFFSSARSFRSGGAFLNASFLSVCRLLPLALASSLPARTYTLAPSPRPVVSSPFSASAFSLSLPRFLFAFHSQSGLLFILWQAVDVSVPTLLFLHLPFLLRRPSRVSRYTLVCSPYPSARTPSPCLRRHVSHTSTNTRRAYTPSRHAGCPFLIPSTVRP